MQEQQLGASDDDTAHRDPGSAVQKSGEPGDTTTPVPPVVAGKAVKEWSFTELHGDALDQVEVDSGIQVGGLLNEIHDYGPTFRDSDVFFPDETSRPPDGIATGQITSFEDDVTYWVGAEAPAETPRSRTLRSGAFRSCGSRSRSSSALTTRRCPSRCPRRSSRPPT